MIDTRNTQMMPASDPPGKVKQEQVGPLKQAGFTLIEIMMVIAAIGVLMYLLLPGLSGGGSRADAMLMERVANSAKTQYEMINMTCGTSMRMASNKLTTDAVNPTSRELANLLFYGNVHDTYQRCYERSGVTPSSRDVTIRGDDTIYLVDTDFPITFEDQERTADDARAFIVAFSDVDRDTAEALAQRFEGDMDLADLESQNDFPGSAGGSAPLNITGSGDALTVKFRYIW